MKKVKDMKRWLKIISLIVLLISCKTEKNVNCDAYTRTFVIPYTDTIITESLHYHLEDEYMCSWVPTDTNIYCDTLYLEVYK